MSVLATLTLPDLARVLAALARDAAKPPAPRPPSKPEPKKERR